MFNDGDIVNIKKNKWSEYDKYDIKTNLEIKCESGSDYCVYLSDRSDYWYVRDVDLELVSQEETKKFKIGDKVRIKQAVWDNEEVHGYQFDFKDINEGTIKEVADGDGECEVFMLDKSDWWFVDEEDLELITKESDPSTWKRNTPIVVSEGGNEYRRHFNHFEDGKVFYYSSGKTSYTNSVKNSHLSVTLENARLATKEELK